MPFSDEFDSICRSELSYKAEIMRKKYSVNLLRMLLGMELITEDEYNKIVAISEDHYGAKIYCV